MLITTNRKKYRAFLILLLVLSAPVLAQSNNSPDPGYKDTRVREYLAPSRIVWVEGSFPTKHGVLHVRHEKNKDGSISSEIQKPDGLVVR